jgi:hypothetical protein
VTKVRARRPFKFSIGLPKGDNRLAVEGQGSGCGEGKEIGAAACTWCSCEAAKLERPCTVDDALSELDAEGEPGREE